MMASAIEVKLCCGDAIGTLLLTTGRVSCQGQELSMPEFERIGGKASCKKWRQSVRVINGDGTTGKVIGDWLTEKGLDVRNNKVIKVDGIAVVSQGPSIAVKPITQPMSPVDVRRELATPITQKMHSAFGAAKPMEKEQKLEVTRKLATPMGQKMNSAFGTSKAMEKEQIPDVRRDLATPVKQKMHPGFSASKPMEKRRSPATLQPLSHSQQGSLQPQNEPPHASTSAEPAAPLSHPPVKQPSLQGSLQHHQQLPHTSCPARQTAPLSSSTMMQPSVQRDPQSVASVFHAPAQQPSLQQPASQHSSQAPGQHASATAQTSALQFQVHMQHSSLQPSTRPPVTDSVPPKQRPDLKDTAQDKSSEAHIAVVHTLPTAVSMAQPAQVPAPSQPASGTTLLQASSGQGLPSMPPSSLPALKTPGTSPWMPDAFQKQQGAQHKPEASMSAAHAINMAQMQALLQMVAPPAVAPPMQSSSTSMLAPSPMSTPQLAIVAAGKPSPQMLQQGKIVQSQADVAPAIQQAPKQTTPKKRKSVPVLQAPPAEPVETDLVKHLQTTYPGLIPGDSTAGLPKELRNISPDSNNSERTLFDLATISEEELMAMSKDSAESPLGDILADPPGHRPVKRQRSTIVALNADEAAAQIGQYMAGELTDEPWQAFGLRKAPIVGGRALNLKQFYKSVQAYGGFAACVAHKSFAKVTTKLGIDKGLSTDASYHLRNLYTRFLLAYERQMQLLASAEGAAKRLDRGASDETAVAAEQEGALVDDAEVRSAGAEADAALQEAAAMEDAGFSSTGALAYPLLQQADAIMGVAEVRIPGAAANLSPQQGDAATDEAGVRSSGAGVQPLPQHERRATGVAEVRSTSAAAAAAAGHDLAGSMKAEQFSAAMSDAEAIDLAAAAEPPPGSGLASNSIDLTQDSEEEAEGAAQAAGRTGVQAEHGAKAVLDPEGLVSTTASLPNC